MAPEIAATSGRLATFANPRYPEASEEPPLPTRNVNLTDHYDRFIETSIAEGRFSNASEAVRAGLHLLERQAAEDKAKLEWLRSAVQEGIDSLERGEGIRLNSRADIDCFVDEIRAEVLAGQRKRRVSA